MLGKSLIKAAAGNAAAITTDEFWDDTMALYHFDSVSNADVYTDSILPLNWTTRGTPQQTSGSPGPSGYWSYLMGANGLTFGSSAGLALSTSDFTIEAWIKTPALGKTIASSRVVTGTGTNYWSFTVSASGELTLQSRTSGGTQYFAKSAAGQIQVDTWHHVCAMRTSGQLRVFVDGVLGTQTSDNDSSNNLAETYVAVGLFNYTGFVGNFSGGLISNFRIVKDNVYATTGFTPPTEPIESITNTTVLTCRLACISENASFLLPATADVAASKAVPFIMEPYSSAIYNGSMVVTGTANIYYDAFPTSLQIGTNNFSVEIWCWSTGTGAYQRLVDSTSGQLIIQKWNQNYVNYVVGGTNYRYASYIIPLYKWTHLCIQRVSGTAYFYFNGKLVDSVSKGNNMTDYVKTVGSRYGNSENFQGILSGYRLIKGSAAYPLAGFTPEGHPENITNTVSLLRFENAKFPDTTRKMFLVPSGANLSTTTVKYGDGSVNVVSGTIYDRAGHAKSAGDNYIYGPFTIECFVYITDTPGQRDICRELFDGAARFSVTLGKLEYYSSASGLTTAATTIPLNEWVHVAVVRESTATNGLKIYENGVLKATGTDTDNYDFATGTFEIVEDFNGWVDEFRISKIARYTGEFTPPDAPFPDKK